MLVVQVEEEEVTNSVIRIICLGKSHKCSMAGSRRARMAFMISSKLCLSRNLR